MRDISRKRVFSALIWKVTESISVKGIAFIVSVVIARILDPSEYGVLSLVTVFTALATVFVQSGLGQALIQDMSTSDEDYSTVFFACLAIASIFYLVLYITAPIIASYYKIDEVTPILRVISLILFPNALNSVQISRLSKCMDFKHVFRGSLYGTIVSGIVGITMAYAGFGIWALVAQQLSNSIVICIAMLYITDWKPRVFFSWPRFRALFSYGWKLLVSALIVTLNQDIRTLVIGKKYSAGMLGQYNRGQQFPQLAMNVIDGSLNSVLFPAYSTAQDNPPRLKQMMRRSIVTSTFIVFPIMMVLMVTAKVLVPIVLTEKWLPCIPFLQICCIAFALYPIHTANLQAINAIGRSDVFLRLEIIKMVLSLSVLIITVFCFDSIMAIAIGGMFTAPIAMIVNSFPNRKLLNYKLEEQIKDLAPSFFLTLAMGLLVWLASLLRVNAILSLLIQIVVGVVSYIGLAWVFKLKCFVYLKDTLFGMMTGRRERS